MDRLREEQEQLQYQQPQAYNEQYRVTTQQKLFGVHEIPGRKGLIQQTYLLLAVAVFGAMAGAYVGITSGAVLQLFAIGSMFGWILIMIGLYLVPRIALAVATKMPRLAVPALALDGVFSGLVLSPLIYVGINVSGVSDGPNLVHSALVVTGAVFAAITFYVFTAGKHFSAPKGLMFGAFAVLCVAIPVNMVLIGSSFLSTIIVAVVGLFGVAILVYTTSDILHNPDYKEPAFGALCLFAGLFNLFEAILWLLISGRD